MTNLYDRYKDDILSDNTRANYCELCKDCVHWGKNSPWDNKHDKCYCEMYPYPNSSKPLSVINNAGPCTYRKVK